MRLDKDQEVVAQHNHGAMLVLAGAGSGKTASITGRAANLIKRGIRPDSLLLTTFSKKAASEMKTRLGALVGDEMAAQATICTFHSLGDKIIKEWPTECEREMGMSILDESDQRGLFRRLLKEVVKVDNLKDLDYRKWLSAYDRLAQDGARAVESQHANRFCEIMQTHAGIERQDQLNWLWRVFGAFEKFKREQNVVDFNDLLTLPRMALERHEMLRDALAFRYPYVTVDEAQDTCIAQYDVIRLFAKSHGNIVVVGDDDQSIYGWRGASVDNMKRFIRDFNPQVARLERNYRSTRPIVAAAAQMIANNTGRLLKNPYSECDEGAAPVFHSNKNDHDMAHSIVADIKVARAQGVPWNEQAILYRKNRIGEILEPLLLEHNVPYEVYGGKKLTDRKEVKLAMALARLVINPRDQMAFHKLADGIKGLGERGVESLCSDAEQFSGGDLFANTEVIRNAKARESVEHLGSLVGILRRRSPEELIPTLVNEIGISTYFPKETEKQLEQRMDRLGRFADWISLLVEKQRKMQSDLDPWHMILQATLEEPETDLSDNDKVILSTVHRAKGLEWERVYIAGASDGLMPMANKSGEVSDEQEERRLAYVGSTRAAKVCTLYHCAMLNLGYDTLLMNPSPYLAEMGATPGRSLQDPLPLIPKLKREGGVDVGNLVAQQIAQSAEQRESAPEPITQEQPERTRYSWESQEIPGW